MEAERARDMAMKQAAVRPLGQTITGLQATITEVRESSSAANWQPERMAALEGRRSFIGPPGYAEQVEWLNTQLTAAPPRTPASNGAHEGAGYPQRLRILAKFMGAVRRERLEQDLNAADVHATE